MNEDDNGEFKLERVKSQQIYILEIEIISMYKNYGNNLGNHRLIIKLLMAIDGNVYGPLGAKGFYLPLQWVSDSLAPRGYYVDLKL